MKKLYNAISWTIAAFGAYLVLKTAGNTVLHLRDIEKRQDAVEEKNREVLDAIGEVSTAMGAVLGHGSGIPAKVKRLESDVRQLKVRAGIYPGESLSEVRERLREQIKGMPDLPLGVESSTVAPCPIDHRTIVPTAPGGVIKCPRCGDEIHRSSRAAD